MAVQWCDDFNSYGTNPALLLNGLYADQVVGLNVDPDPSASGNVVRFAGFANRLRRVLSSTQDTVGICFRIWIEALPDVGRETVFVSFLSASTFRAGVGINSVGQMSIWRVGNQVGFDAVLIGRTAVPVITANAWTHIEFKATGSAGAGVVELRINGVTVLFFDSVNTGGTMDQIFWSGTDNRTGSNVVAFQMKDLVVYDDNGGVNDDFMGTVLVVGRAPNSDNVLNWTPSTGTMGYPLIDNAPPDDAQYISAANPPPGSSRFGLTPLPIDVTTVRAQVTQVRARKVDGGDGNLQSALVSGGTVGLGADRPITTAFTYYVDVFDFDPHTATAWTPATANASLLQVNRTV